MHKKVLLSGVALVLGVFSPTRLAAQEQISVASLPYLQLKVTLTHTAAGIPRLVEKFSTSDEQHHNVFCISGFRDVQYILRDRAGAVVSGDRQPWKRGTDLQYSSGMSWNPKGPNGPDPCKALKENVAYRVVLLSDLYPDLKPGNYTLQITLAPRGTSERASLPPISINI